MVVTGDRDKGNRKVLVKERSFSKQSVFAKTAVAHPWEAGSIWAEVLRTSHCNDTPVCASENLCIVSSYDTRWNTGPRMWLHYVICSCRDFQEIVLFIFILSPFSLGFKTAPVTDSVCAQSFLTSNLWHTPHIRMRPCLLFPFSKCAVGRNLYSQASCPQPRHVCLRRSVNMGSVWDPCSNSFVLSFKIT